MGISIYYDATRSYPLTCEENRLIEDIVNKFNKKRPEYDDEETEAIFSGATRLPTSIANPMITYEGCMYWAKCLTQIRRVVKDAKWYASMDEDELKWDEKEGWHLPIE